MEGLSNQGVKISRSSALRLLESRGVESGLAKEFLNSFDGPMSVRRAGVGEEWLRYTKEPDVTGRFLTKDFFNRPQDAIRELVLDPKQNNAAFLQSVISKENPIIIEGRIRGNPSQRIQYLINPKDFRFSRGRRYYD